MKIRMNNNDIKPKAKHPVNRAPEPLHFIVYKRPRSKKRVGLQLGSFILATILVISLIQGAIYLSSAKNASGEILGAATTAYSDLNSASKNLSQQNLTGASELFVSAQANVKLAQDKLDNYKPLTWVAPQANSADHILKGAGYLAAAGEKLANALNIFSELKVSSKGVETSDFEAKLNANKQALVETRNLVSSASSEFDQVSSIPMDYENTLQKAKDQVFQLGAVLDKLIGLEDLYLGIFGGEKTYFLIFQNYDEQRATGGFIGTYGVLRTKHGTISKLSIDSIYDLDGRINELVAAPGPFQPDIKRWGIRDANWFIDFPTSAKKLLYFFEKGQETADGVLSLTPKVFEKLLTMVGPIEMKDYDVTLTAENFQDVVQYKTSVDYDRQENEPKKMLADFAPILLDRLTNLPQEKWLQFFQIMQENLTERQVLVYSKDADVQKSIDDLGFSGRVLAADHDYLMVANTNLGGTKTDLEIEQSVDLISKVLSDGSIMNSLTINRKNNSPVNNRNYIRVLVPKGAEYISSSGFDTQTVQNSSSDGLETDPDLLIWDRGDLRGNVFVRTEAGKTEYAGWINTDGDGEKTITINYMLPFKISSVHSLLLQKQAGSKPFQFTSTMNLGDHNADWFTNGVSRNGSNLIFGSNSNTDDIWGFVIK
jgi:hypothetical protein